MEIRTLRYFLEIAYTHNMTTAANSLHVSQSALSHQMKELEAELGCNLFERTNRQTLLTDEGKHFLSRAEEILSLVDKTQKEYETRDKNITGQIYIGAGESSYMELLGHAAKKLRDSHPGITFNIFSGNADSILDRMSKGVLDFALLFEPVSKEDLNYFELPFTHESGIVVPKTDKLASRSRVTVQDLENKPLIINSRNNIDKKYISQTYGIKESKLNIVASGNLNFNKAMLAKSGLGIILTTNISTTPLDPDLVFIPLEPALPVHLIFAWSKNHSLSRAAELYLEEVQNSIFL